MIRALLLALCLLAGCAAPYAYEVTRENPPSRYTAYAVTPHFLLGVLHGDVREGETVFVQTMRGPIRGVVEFAEGETVAFKTFEPLRRGDSGAGVLDAEGNLVGLLVGRRLD